jgi:arginine utilization protein RocB
LIPIKEKIQIAGFAVIQDENIDNATQFFRLTAQAIENDCDFAFIDLNITNEDITKLRVRIIDAKLLIFAFFFKAKAYLGNAGISDKITDIIKKLSAERPTIAILFGSPYIADKIPANLYIHTFSDSLSSIAAAVLYICGRKPV